MSDAIKVYLSIPISCSKDAIRIEEYLSMQGIEVLNPCRIVHGDSQKGDIPLSIAEKCWGMINESNAVILYTDHYGRDCTCEIGYAYAKSKPIFPFYLHSEADFLQEDWMLKSLLKPTSEGLESLVDKIRNCAKSNLIGIV